MSSAARARSLPIMGGSHSAANANMPRSWATRSKWARLCGSPSRTACTPVLSWARAVMRCEAVRMTSSATRPPIEWPAIAKRSGATASTCSAIACIEEKPRNDTTETSATLERRWGISVQNASSHKSPHKSTNDCFIIGDIMARDIYQAVRESCLWLPEAEEFVSHGSPNFRVRGKTFATYVVNHHGDGRVALWLNAMPGSQETHVRAEPKHYFVPPYVGPKGWLGVNLDRGIDWDQVPNLVREGYEKVAPPDLRAQIGKTPRIKPPAKALSPAQIDPFKSARPQAVLAKLRK